MSDHARIDRAIIDFLKPELKKYRRQMLELESAVTATTTKAAAHADEVVSDRRRRLGMAVRDLSSCELQEDSDCSGFRRRVEECEHALDRAIAGRDRVEQATMKFRHSQKRHTTIVGQTLDDGVKLVNQVEERSGSYVARSSFSAQPTIIAYQNGRASGPPSVGGLGSFLGAVPEASGETRGWREQPGVSTPDGYPMGFAKVPLSYIVEDDPVSSASEFDAGQSVSDLKWSVNALYEVVMPAMESIDSPRDYLASRDISEGRSGSRSYVSTFDGFFGASTPIKLRPRQDGTFDVVNGRHRLWLARVAGGSHVPAEVRG